MGDLPLYRLCNFVYYRIVEGQDERGQDQFRARLWMPPKGEVPDERSPWSAENESKGFAALSAQIGKTKSTPVKQA